MGPAPPKNIRLEPALSAWNRTLGYEVRGCQLAWPMWPILGPNQEAPPDVDLHR